MATMSDDGMYTDNIAILEHTERSENLNDIASDGQRDVIRMMNEDGTIFEMEDNIVLPDSWDDVSDEEAVDLDGNIEVCD